MWLASFLSGKEVRYNGTGLSSKAKQKLYCNEHPSFQEQRFQSGRKMSSPYWDISPTGNPIWVLQPIGKPVLENPILVFPRQ